MIVLYSAIFGGSDRIKRAPKGPDACVVFTDDASLAGSGWCLLYREPPPKPRRAARALKMLPHTIFSDADAWLWVDGSIEIKDWPRLMADIGDAEIACLPHPDRSTCYAEGETVIRLKIAHDVARQQVQDAMTKYRAEGFAPTSLSTTGLFWRRNTERVRAFNDLWYEELNRYGTNDQVHVDYCAWKVGVPIKHLSGHYRDNAYSEYDGKDHRKRRQPQFLLERDCQNYLEDA